MENAGAIAAAAKDEEGQLASNLQAALKGFEGAGYLVVHRKVSPEKAGIPMTRNRYHFQAVLAGFLDGEAGFMKDLAETWDTILQGPFQELPLDAFLLDAGCQDLQDSLQGMRTQAESGDKFCKENKARWVSMHLNFFKQHEAMRLPRFRLRVFHPEGKLTIRQPDFP